MKVLLIYPTDWQGMFLKGPSFMRQADATRRLPPIGLLYIAAHLKKRTAHEVAILDAQLEDLKYDEIEARIREHNPDVVGISAYTHTLLDTLEIARRTKRVNPKIFVIVGGHHAGLYPAETAMLECVDAAAVGEGEELLTELVEALANKRPIEEVPGLYLRGPDKAIATPPRRPIDDLDSIPFPARDLLPKNAFKYAADVEKFSTTMISSRGCPFKCVYCDVPFREIRARSPKNVVDEIGECVEAGIREIHFFDDNFNFDEDRVVAICREIIDRGHKINFSVRARPDRISREIVDWLSRAGCNRISLGIESADDEMLRRIKKGTNVQMIERAVKLIKEGGIEIAAYFIIGLPGQTEEGVRRTFKFAIDMDLDYAQFNYLGLLPGTELYADALRSKAFDRDMYLEFATSPAPTDKIAYWPNPIPFDEIVDLMKLGYKKFYLRPSYIWKRLGKIKTLNELKLHVLAGFYVVAYSVFSWFSYKPLEMEKNSPDDRS